MIGRAPFRHYSDIGVSIRAPDPIRRGFTCDCGQPKGADDPACVRCRHTCECGNRKPYTAEACKRCEYLDGSARYGCAYVIDALRGTDGLTIVELRDQLGRQREALQRTLNRLVETGRVRRYWREDYAGTRQQRTLQSREPVEIRNVSGCWVYALDGDERRAS